ncbi:hypothetical protein [Cellulomonas sp. URHB0016]
MTVAHARASTRLSTAVRWTAAAVAVTGVVQVLLGLWWWCANLGSIPEYGDTPEYLVESVTFAIDGYRTLAYPLVLRAAMDVGDTLGIPWHPLVAGVQLVVSVLATWFLVRAVTPTMQRRWVAAVTAVVVTLPLPLHYTVAVLTDSLAASALLVFAAGLARVVARDDRRPAAVVAVAGGCAASVLIRPDRTYICLGIAGVAGIYLLVRLLRHHLTMRAFGVGVVILVTCAVVPAFAATALNEQTQTADLGRQQQTVSGALFDRIAYEHLEELAPLLDPEIAAEVPDPPAVEAFDSRGTALAQLRASTGADGVNAVIRAAIGCCALEVAGQTALDVAHVALGPFAVSADWLSGASTYSQWDFTRMAGPQPALSRAVMAWSVVMSALLVLVIAVVSVACRRGWAEDKALGGVLLVLGTTALACAAFFTLMTSLDPNPRYTLVTQMIIAAAPLALLARVRFAPAPLPPGADRASAPVALAAGA